jgi:hypothetical protein
MSGTQRMNVDVLIAVPDSPVFSITHFVTRSHVCLDSQHYNLPLDQPRGLVVTVSDY